MSSIGSCGIAGKGWDDCVKALQIPPACSVQLEISLGSLIVPFHDSVEDCRVEQQLHCISCISFANSHKDIELSRKYLKPSLRCRCDKIRIWDIASCKINDERVMRWSLTSRTKAFPTQSNPLAQFIGYETRGLISLISLLQLLRTGIGMRLTPSSDLLLH
ncbi:hypothetical protein VTK26DRAFT_4316 [Humicola hyalothermophila]